MSTLSAAIAGQQGFQLSTDELHPALEDATLSSMTFLNEIAERYPRAVSLAAGRPFEGFFSVDEVDRYVRRFCRYLEEDLGLSTDEVAGALFQYGRTKGLIHHLVAENLLRDEGIRADPESIVVTVGCQEAIFLVLRALRADPTDVLLAVEPTYVGLTGAARLVDMPVVPVRSGPAGIDLADLAAQVANARAVGLRPRACYVMPDFANPSGVSLNLADRKRLLELARSEGILLLEDNPYGLFRYDGSTRMPSLKAMDEHQNVVYLGSFAKTTMPGARVGYLVADQQVTDASGGQMMLADHLARIKSMVTVNTSPIAQAVVGGKLLDNDGSLVAASARERAIYADNMHLMVAGLTARFPRPEQGVRSTMPTGGFFVVVTVPFTVDDALLERSAADYGVLWTPMHHFYEAGASVNALRLSCSSATPEEIDTGLDRLAALINDRLDELSMASTEVRKRRPTPPSRWVGAQRQRG